MAGRRQSKAIGHDSGAELGLSHSAPDAQRGKASAPVYTHFDSQGQGRPFQTLSSPKRIVECPNDPMAKRPKPQFQGQGKSAATYPITQKPSLVHSLSTDSSGTSARTVSSAAYSFDDSNTSNASYPDSDLPDDEASDYLDFLDQSFCFYDACPEPDFTSDSTVCSAVAQQSLQDRLKNIWPNFALRGLEKAPLAIRWEATRIAQHCDLSVADCDIPYELDCPEWHDQSRLRQRFTTRDIPLPRRSEQKAWQTALKGFQSRENAVVLSANLVPSGSKSGPLYKLLPCPLELHLSHRLDRRFGADRFLYVSMALPRLVAKEIIEWLVKGPHYFLGRVWQAFYIDKPAKTKQQSSASDTQKTARDKSQVARVFFFAIDGDHFRPPREPDSLPLGLDAINPAVRQKLSLGGFFSWVIGFDNTDNKQQQLPKLFSRIALSLTRCRATVILKKEQIRHRRHDIYSFDAGNDKPPVMNDGIGRISPSLANKIARHLGLDEYPCCFQGRFGSAKGVWICATGIQDGRDWIETFPSQRKWKCNYDDPLHRTFEVHSWPRKPKASHLNIQFIPLLEEGARDRGAMRRRFAQLVEDSIAEDLDEIKTALMDTVDMRQWLYKHGKTKDSGSDLQKTMPFLGALPKSSEDEAAYMLDAGFDHGKLKRLQQNCLKLGTQAMERLKSKMHIQIPQSASLLMVVDFDDVLAEDEIHVHFACNYNSGDLCDMMLQDRDVLVARSPAHLPSDIRKVRAVFRPELHRLGNVAVFPIKGKRPLADFLSGGDYDGDTAWVCFDSQIVDNFDNCDLAEGDLVADGYIGQRKGSIYDVQERQGLEGEALCCEFIRQAFDFVVQPSLLGSCTKYKERFCYWQNAVNSIKAITLGHLLAKLVDQPKQGLLFDETHWLSMRRRLKLPAGLDEPAYCQDKTPVFAKGKARHVLDYLKFDVALPRIDEARIELERSIEAHGQDAQDFDAELTVLHNYYDQEAQTNPDIAALLTNLRAQLQALCNAWSSHPASASYQARVLHAHEQWLALLPCAAWPASLLPSLFEPWIKDPDASRWALLKASTTFHLFYQRRCDFAWRVAGRSLCLLKALAAGGQRERGVCVVVADIYMALKPNRRYIERRRAAVEEEEEEEEEEVDVDELDFDPEDFD
ncbi:hypothetical protein CDD81_262 [Ophiocordyceps australis]|uniref:RNA-dependent RNA polymerase n=1 Tax=Ophiocordyceps australis TaxID=1399860 RepID=A0A2C5XBJ1_9HYPO|nr:hypothetical protein CDD81_262 [Ophiocordyceps australis]